MKSPPPRGCKGQGRSQASASGVICAGLGGVPVANQVATDDGGGRTVVVDLGTLSFSPIIIKVNGTTIKNLH